jgi:hypothetical protein
MRISRGIGMADYDELRGLLDRYKHLPPSRLDRPTILEIADFPHDERVWSRILAFFLNPAKPHGLGTLFLDALLPPEVQLRLPTVEVETEVETDNGNFIDILISSDSHLIAIENKVVQNLTNPFKDYAQYLDKISEGRAALKYLLAPRKVTAKLPGGFQSRIYSDYLARIRSIEDKYLRKADRHYRILFKDFLSQVERHLEKRRNMEPMLLKFFRENDTEIDAMLERFYDFRKELRDKVKALGVCRE